MVIWFFGTKEIFLTEMSSQMEAGAREREVGDTERQPGPRTNEVPFRRALPEFLRARGVVKAQTGPGKIKAALGSMSYANLLGGGQS